MSKSLLPNEADSLPAYGWTKSLRAEEGVTAAGKSAGRGSENRILLRRVSRLTDYLSTLSEVRNSLISSARSVIVFFGP